MPPIIVAYHPKSKKYWVATDNYTHFLTCDDTGWKNEVPPVKDQTLNSFSLVCENGIWKNAMPSFTKINNEEYYRVTDPQKTWELIKRALDVFEAEKRRNKAARKLLYWWAFLKIERRCRYGRYRWSDLISILAYISLIYVVSSSLVWVLKIIGIGD